MLDRITRRAVAAFVVLTASALPARAQGPSPSQIDSARERFATGRKLENDGKWSAALDAFQQVAAIKMTPQVRFHIALCMENVGLLTQALDGFMQAGREAAGVDPNVVAESDEHAKKIEPMIPTITIHLTGASASDRVSLDHRTVPIGDPPLPLRVDPGPHTVEVERGADVVARRYFVAEAKTTKPIELTVGTVETTPEAPLVPTATPPAVDTSSAGSTQRKIGVVALGVGAASAIATGVFIGLRAHKKTQLDEACPSQPTCSDPSADSIVSAGKTDAAMVDVFAIVTAVSVATGVVLLVTAPSAKPAAAVVVAPAVSRSGGGLFLSGRF